MKPPDIQALRDASVIHQRIEPTTVITQDHECMAALIYRHPHLVLDHVAVGEIQQITFVMPHNPDFDTVLVAYFTQHLIECGVLPVGAQELSDYTHLIASNTLPPTTCPWNTPFGVFQGIRAKDRRYCAQHGLSQAHSDRYCLQRGFYLMEYLCLQIAEGGTLDAPDLFQAEYPFEQERKLLRERND